MREAPRSGHGQAGFVRRRGFTLVELLIVVAIILVLIAMAGLGGAIIGERTKLARCQQNLKMIHQVLMQYAAASDGWFPEFNPYWGTHIRRACRWGDGSQPPRTRWQAMSDVAMMKQMGGSAEVFFCPFHPRYGDPKDWPYRTWERPGRWHNENDGNDYATVHFGYYFLINRGWLGRGRLIDDRQCIQKDSAGEDDLPIVADLLHYRREDLKRGWWHGGGPEVDKGLFNSSCNTLYLGGYVILKNWEALDEQGQGTESGSDDMWWFWLGN